MNPYEPLLKRAEELLLEMLEVLREIRAVQRSQDSSATSPPETQPIPPPVPKAPARPPRPQREFQTRDVALRIAAALLLFSVVEYAVFRSGFYANFLSPESTAGQLMINIRLEQNRKLKGPNEVLSLGDSRMGIWTRVTDQLMPETGYSLANIATFGTYPRCWYYMLREVDPDRLRYAAVLVPVDELEDEDWGDWSQVEGDMHYLLPLLRVSDTYSFVRSFPTWRLRWRALRTIFFKGFSYNRDFQDLLETYTHRMLELKWAREELAHTRYVFVGPAKTMAGLQVDWAAHKITQYPPGTTESERLGLDSELVRPVANYTGEREAYRRLWFGRIIDYYRGSRTRVIFLRIPRGPVVRPYPTNAKSSVVREFAARGQAILLDEHTFEELEQPAFFWDGVHMNEAGCVRFSELLARAVGTALGHPRQAGL